MYIHRWKLTFKVSTCLNSSAISNGGLKTFYLKDNFWGHIDPVWQSRVKSYNSLLLFVNHIKVNGPTTGH